MRKHIYYLILPISIGLLFSFISKTKKSHQNAIIKEVFFAQTHVLKPSSPYFKLVSKRSALIKANIISHSGSYAPEVYAILTLNGRSQRLLLKGPKKLPKNIPTHEHTFSNSFTTTIPSSWVQPGLKVKIQAGNASKVFNQLKIGAPSVMNIRYFDFKTFGDTYLAHQPTKALYKEIEAKLPVCDLKVKKAGEFDLPAICILPYNNQPARIATGHAKDNWQGMTFSHIMLPALARANGERHTTFYIGAMSTAHGGWGGGKSFAGTTTPGVFWHELGHAISLLHCDSDPKFPYTGDFQWNAGPTWAYDPIKKYFIPSRIQKNAVSNLEHVGKYKRDPMWGGGDGDQEKGYILRHYSDYNVALMQKYMEEQVDQKAANGSYVRWDKVNHRWKPTDRKSWEYPSRENVNVYTLFGTVSVTPKANFIYDPIAYNGNLVETFDPTSAQGLQKMRASGYAVSSHFTVKVIQGGRTKHYAIHGHWNPNEKASSFFETQGWALNVPKSNGPIESIEVFYTPDLGKNPYPANPKRVSKWQRGKINYPVSPRIQGTIWNDINRNGIQDRGEKGIAGVEVEAWWDRDNDGLGNWRNNLGVAKTDKNGRYSFGGVYNGTWQVYIREGSGNYKKGGSLHNFKNSPNAADPNTNQKGRDHGVLGGGKYGAHNKTYISKPFQIRNAKDMYVKVHPSSKRNIDFGFYHSNSDIGGKVWRDSNKNGIQDHGEKGISGVKLIMWKDVNNDGKPDHTGYCGLVTTDKNGFYNYPAVQDGTYQVFVWEAENFAPGEVLHQLKNSPGEADPRNHNTKDDNGLTGGGKNGGTHGSVVCRPIHINSTYKNGKQDGVTSVDFGFYSDSDNGNNNNNNTIDPYKDNNIDNSITGPSTTIKGHIWHDINKNGKKDKGEKGIPNVKLILWRDSDNDGMPDWKGFNGGVSTDANGNYKMENLTSDVYQIFVWEVENFEPSGALYGMTNSLGETNPTLDDNGYIGGSGPMGGTHGSFICAPIKMKIRSKKTANFGFYKK